MEAKLLSHLSRITTAGRQFIPQIDGLRFLAIMAVLAFHVWAVGTFHMGRPGDISCAVAQSMNAGSLGVMLFFAISGFILALPFARQYQTGGKLVCLKDYYWRRITRIEPPYVIQLVLVFVYTALILRSMPSHQHLYGQAGWLKYTASHMLASLFYLHDVIYQGRPYPNIVLWSLEIEVQFYILAPLLTGLFAIRRPWKRRTIILLTILVWPWLIKLSNLETLAGRVGLLACLPFFMTGFLLVEIYLSGWLTAGRAFGWDLLMLLGGVAVVLDNSQILPGFLLPWILLLVCVAAFRGRLAADFLGNPWITTIGGMCYTIVPCDR